MSGHARQHFAERCGKMAEPIETSIGTNWDTGGPDKTRIMWVHPGAICGWMNTGRDHGP